MTAGLAVAVVEAGGRLLAPGVGQAVAQQLVARGGNQAALRPQLLFGAQHGFTFRLEGVIGFGLQGQNGRPVGRIYGSDASLGQHKQGI